MANEKLFKGGVEILDGAYVLKVSKDRLHAAVFPKEKDDGKKADIGSLTAAQIRGALFENDIVEGLMPEPAPCDMGGVCVASGTPPVHGDNARVKMHVQPSMVRTPKQKEPGKDVVDFRELGSIVNVAAAQLLLEKIPLTQGTPGRDVFGTEISPKPGKDLTLKTGPGVELSEDGMRVVSKVDGKFIMADGKPSVYEEHVVKGDVDLSVGNIAFGGKKLIVNGEVLPGFKVRCKGDILINKGINNAEVMAGGRLEIMGSLVGDELLVRSKGDMVVGFVENGPRLETLGDLIVKDFVVQGHARVGRSIRAVANSGALIGGDYVAGGSVYAKDLGSDGEVVTEVTVGLNPALEHKKKKLEEEMAIWPERLNQTLKNIGTLEQMKKKEGLSPDKAELLKKLTTVMPKLMDRVNKLTEFEKQLQEELEKQVAECVYVLGTIYAGVTIKIGSAARMITEEESQVVVYFDKSSHQIRLRKLSSDECGDIERMANP